MHIKEMTFSGKHYQEKQACEAVLDICKALPVESLHTAYNATTNEQGGWFTFSKVSICFKVKFDSKEEMLSIYQELLSIQETKAKRSWDSVKRQWIEQDETPIKVYQEILKIIEKKDCA
jgi:hypothetical protein